MCLLVLGTSCSCNWSKTSCAGACQLTSTSRLSSPHMFCNVSKTLWLTLLCFNVITITLMSWLYKINMNHMSYVYHFFSDCSRAKARLCISSVGVYESLYVRLDTYLHNNLMVGWPLVDEAAYHHATRLGCKARDWLSQGKVFIHK